MMDTICPQGHSSVTTDYCDQCGTPIAVPPVAADADAEISSVTEVRVAEATAELCPLCDTPRTPGDRYCEVDGYDFERPGESVAVWSAVVRADRARFELLSPDDLEFPDAPTTLTCALDAESVSVGRQSPSRASSPTSTSPVPTRTPACRAVTCASTNCPTARMQWSTVVRRTARRSTTTPRRSHRTRRCPSPRATTCTSAAWTTITIVRQTTGATSA